MVECSSSTCVKCSLIYGNIMGLFYVLVSALNHISCSMFLLRHFLNGRLFKCIFSIRTKGLMMAE